MSKTDLIEFRNNVPDTCHEFKNSWGGAARIWDSLFERYVDKKDQYDMWMRAAEDGRLWQVWKHERLVDAERIVYWFSCDNALIKKENFNQMASALREFAGKHPVDGRVCHLPAWAEVFNKSDADAIGLWATSVTDNPWVGWNDERDEPDPYDLSKGDRHWYVFDRLQQFNDDGKEGQ